jgi:exonuclease SbcC
MIPLKLTLENFKCYRKDVPILYLEGVHIACLSGDNGAGKSSLLDAITWALWGDAVHRPQEELIHLGEQDMRVELEFMAGGAGIPVPVGTESIGLQDSHATRYRVIRRYARGGRSRAGATSLELQVSVGNGEYRSISGNSVRETEAYIRGVAGMDYDTFVNSAFLVQGRADEFTTKRPAQRQRVLADILGLQYYDRIHDRAREKARECVRDIQRVEGEIDVRTQDLMRRPEYEEELPRVKTEVTEIFDNITNVGKEVSRLRDRVESMRGMQSELDVLNRNVTVSMEELKQIRAQETQNRQLIERWESVIANESAVVDQYANLIELLKCDELLNLSLEPYARLEERKRRVSKLVESLPALGAGLTEAQDRIYALEKQDTEMRERITQLRETQFKLHIVQDANLRRRGEMDALKGKIKMLADGGVICPLCGTELGSEAKEHIASKYQADGTLLAQEYRGDEGLSRKLETLLKHLSGDVENEENMREKARSQLDGRIGILSQQIIEARKAQDELGVVVQELDGLGYNPIRHQDIKETLGKMSTVREDHILLEHAKEDLPKAQENLSRVTLLIKRREEEISEAEERIVAIGAESQSTFSNERELNDLEILAGTLQPRYMELLARQGFLEQRLNEYKDTEDKKVELESALSNIRRDRDVFEQLADAFGRTGVQAMLVESAIPELEAEASRLLGRMTDNTMHIKLETQRESQRGDQFETLEIKVADTLGTRSYETFSGGEAFRINFALRIALSKVLSHRAGAPLPTLFIDEGFGTQDAAGRERIMDVIQSIQEDFQRILVITHMDEVKDAFPVRIDVQKTPNGSTFVLRDG